MLKETKEVVPEVAKIIPESYVDFIRRMIPGGVVSLTFCFLTGIPQPTGVWDVIVFLLLSYVVGLTIDSVTDYITSRPSIEHSWKCFGSDSRLMEVIADVLRMPQDEVKQPQDWLKKKKILELIRAEVIDKSPRAATLLPKVVAEEFLLKNLAVGIFLMFILFICILVDVPGLDSPPGIAEAQLWLIFVLFMVCGALVVVAAFHRVERTALRTLYWFRLHYRDRFPAEDQNQGGK